MSTNRRQRLKSTPRILRWLAGEWRHFRLQASLNIAVGVLNVAAGLTIVWLTKLCVDLAVNPVEGSDRSLWMAAVALVVLMALRLALGYAMRWIKATLGVRSKNHLQESIYARLLQSDWQALHRQHTGQLMNRLQEDAADVASFMSEHFPQLITALLQFVGAFVFLYWMDWRLAVLVVVMTPIMLLAAHYYIRRMRQYRHDQRESESSVQAFMQETLQHSLVIKTFEQTDSANRMLQDRHGNLREVIARNTRYSAAAALLVNMAFVAGYLCAFFWGVHQLAAGVITFGALIAFVQLVGQIQEPLRRLTGYASVFAGTFTAVERLLELEEMPRAAEFSPAPVDMDADSIRLDHVTFAYDGGQPVLNDWTARFPKGSVTAIVGPTGAGKTTLISLLLGLLRPQEGEVTTHPSLFAYVPQGNTLLSGTIRHNLQFGNPQATDEEMREALRISDAEFVLESEQGLDMLCGERGGGLSEGQAQRVAIARALLRMAPVLLLDEAFSALDSATASGIMERLVKSDRTIIYITHREALVPMATQVLRVE